MYRGILRCVLLAGFVNLALPTLAGADNTLEKGEYLFQLANCYSCHTDSENDGKALAGGRALETEFGTFYSPNITPHLETGIGAWTELQFMQAVREGISPQGSHYFPSFPYIAYRNISDEDIKAIWSYLQSLPAINQENKPHQLKWFLLRPAMAIWKRLNNPQNEAGRGAYLINTLGHCNECHTPRNAIGILQMDRALTGNKDLSAPDISADKLQNWQRDTLIDLFVYGSLPDGDYVSDHMAEVVEYSTSKWTNTDQNAAIEYLTTP